MQRRAWGIAVAIAAVAAVLAGEQAGVFAVLPSAAKPGRQPGGAWLIPTNQLVAPAARMQAISGRPVDMALDPQGRTLAVLNMRAVEFYEPLSGGRLASAASRSTSYAGVSFAPDGSELWASEADRSGREGMLIVRLGANGLPAGEERIALEGHPVPVGIAFSKDGLKVFIALSRKNALAVYDRKSRKLEREIAVGMAPHGVAVDATRGQVFVTNRGGRAAGAGEVTAPSAGARIATDARTGSTARGTVSVVDAKTWSVREVETGLAPSGLALSPDGGTVAVANGHSDTVTLIDPSSLKTSELKVPVWPEGSFGSQPDTVAWSPDGRTLYVACGGTNSVAVFRGRKFAGAIPAGWFPSALAVERGGALHVASIKGTGNTAKGDGTYNTHNWEGMLQRMDAPAGAALQAGLREVKAANIPRWAASGGIENLRSLGIRHVFLIVNENRTYDQVFGDIEKGNGDAKMAIYGRQVTPNKHALAERYVLLDNIHSTGAISFDGHQWLMMAFVSDYTQRAFAGSPRGYAWRMEDALGVSPKGFFWMGAPAWARTRIYGEFCLSAPGRGAKTWTEYWEAYKQGNWADKVGCSAEGVPALKDLMSPTFPGYDNKITDQIRADEFLREFKQRDAAGTVAEINVLALNTDHTSGTSPGYPTPRAMVADNDLAVGRIVEGISKSKVWKQSLILVIEDDAQNGVDHVDGHRTVGLMVGPHVRRGAVDSNYYTQLS
ncbi:MAG: bifunctional YncE family protein/alkaline phosphatase family protein, partial [Acidobacteria bacterium]|nr:bifunctional YncE family protein/alkaline phosphatase family protein [Acidobacteriota bacterium]